MKTEYRIIKRASSNGRKLMSVYYLEQREQKMSNNPFWGSKLVWTEWKEVWGSPFGGYHTQKAATEHAKRLLLREKAMSVPQTVVATFT